MNFCIKLSTANSKSNNKQRWLPNSFQVFKKCRVTDKIRFQENIGLNANLCIQSKLYMVCCQISITFLLEYFPSYC